MREAMSQRPTTKYAKSGDMHIAYQVIGNGPLALIFVPGYVSNVEYIWEEPSASRFLRRLSSFSRLVLFDKRGTGLSDRVSSVPTLEERMDDVRAVMDAAGIPQAALLGVHEGGPMSILFAATYPDPTIALVLYGSYARRLSAPDYPFGESEEGVRSRIEAMEREWGGPVGIEKSSPSVARDDRYREWWANFLRLSASPGAAVMVLRMSAEIDVRPVLPAISVPTLILHRTGDQQVLVENGRYLSKRIASASFVELSGVDHYPWVGDADSIADEVEEFLTGVRQGPEPDRVLATVLFTDIVASTMRAVSFGDRRWRKVLETYHARVRRELVRFRGRELDTAGDGFFAAFDGPARAIRCACRIADIVSDLGIDIRAGIHTGECEVVGEKLGGIAVHLGARIAALASSREVLVSSTVRDLVAGSGIRFESRGAHTLRGIPGEWSLFAVVSASLF
jgi:class 3 adenylate cyclase